MSQKGKSNPDKLRTPSIQERTIRFIEYLRKNTDKNHPIESIEDIKDAFHNMDLNLGSDNTIRDFYRRIADIFNLDAAQHPTPQSKWRIVYDGYVSLYGDDSQEEDVKNFFRNLYYVHELSHEDLDALTDAVLFSRTIGEKDANRIIKILEEHFASRYYKRRSKGVHKIQEKIVYDKELLRENLKIIQQAIKDGVQIEYKFNGYSHDKKLKPMKDYIRVVSPYYIVADDGRYYLLAANDAYKNTMTIRIDLMTEVRIAEGNGKTDRKGLPRIPIEEVAGMPKSWDENFSYRHLKMAYDSPEKITLRVRSEKNEQGRHIDPDYTFLHDNFGDTYRYLRIDEQDPDYDIVEVRCSPFGIVSLALQYVDKVEILAPEAVRNDVIEKIRSLNAKYRFNLG